MRFTKASIIPSDYYLYCVHATAMHTCSTKRYCKHKNFLFFSEGDSLECRWIGFIDKESEVSYYMFGVGTTEGDDSVYAYTHIDAGTTRYRAKGKYIGCSNEHYKHLQIRHIL